MSKAEQIVKNFIAYLREQRLDSDIPEIIKLLNQKLNQEERIRVISGVKLETEEKEKLQTALIDKWGQHPIEFSVNAKLISGLVIKFRDEIVDTSTESKLRSLKQVLGK